MNEIEYTTSVNGKTVVLGFSRWMWRVWMEGKGNIGSGYSKEEAQSEAEKYLGISLTWQ